jgi:hypothetical protein
VISFVYISLCLLSVFSELFLSVLSFLLG